MNNSEVRELKTMSNISLRMSNIVSLLEFGCLLFFIAAKITLLI